MDPIYIFFAIAAVLFVYGAIEGWEEMTGKKLNLSLPFGTSPISIFGFGPFMTAIPDDSELYRPAMDTELRGQILRIR